MLEEKDNNPLKRQSINRSLQNLLINIKKEIEAYKTCKGVNYEKKV